MTITSFIEQTLIKLLPLKQLVFTCHITTNTELQYFHQTTLPAYIYTYLTQLMQALEYGIVVNDRRTWYTTENREITKTPNRHAEMFKRNPASNKNRKHTMTTYFVTRHQGAKDWAEQQGLSIDQMVEHLDSNSIHANDIVIGTFPINLTAEI